MRMENNKKICREILTIAEHMHEKIASQDRIDDQTWNELRKQGKEMERLTDQFK